MDEEIALDLMEIYFASSKAWSRIEETCKKQGFLLDVIDDMLEQVDELIMQRTGQKHSASRMWSTTCGTGDIPATSISPARSNGYCGVCAKQGSIDIDVDPSNYGVDLHAIPLVCRGPETVV